MEDDEKIIKQRWVKKRASIQELANNISKLRRKAYKDLDSDDEKTRLTALVVLVMDKTAERVGNQDSEISSHFGVTGFKKNHLKIDGNSIKLDYTGKSGVEHDKQFSDERIAKALKTAKANCPKQFVFCTKDGFRIKSDRVNRYLREFNITSKSIRGYSSNRMIITRLKQMKTSKDEAQRKKDFKKVLKAVSQKIGHGTATLHNHYMLPELKDNYVEKGKVTDITNLEKYQDGGVIVDKPSIASKPRTKAKQEKTKKTSKKTPSRHNPPSSSFESYYGKYGGILGGSYFGKEKKEEKMTEKDYRKHFEDKKLLTKAKKWLKENPPPAEWKEGGWGRWAWAYTEMPV